MAGNLTRNEARERAELIRVQSYEVSLDLTGGESIFRSRTTARFTCTQPGAATFVDLTAPEVTQIVLNGQDVDLSAFDGHRIALTGLAASNELLVVADCGYNRNSEGLHRFTDPADKGVYMYTDLETFDAHQVFACFDQPDLKATFQLSVLAQDDWEVITNMPPASDPEPAGPGRRRWLFMPTPPLSTYITAVCAGSYHVVRRVHDGIPLGVYCRQSLAGYLDPEEIFEVTAQGFDFFHQTFGIRYPFPKYDQVFVPEFKTGAMENPGCVTIREACIFRSRVTDAQRESRGATILHEMAHMWFGDLVTMRWWDDLWLNESFASWAGNTAQAEATRWTRTWTTFAQLDKVWAYRQDQLPSTHPIAADIPDIAAVEVNFDGITYAKGASVLKQLVAYVGRENFLAGVRAYFDAHAWGNASLGDLLTALEQASGRELASWSKAWLETAGVNTLRAVSETSADGTYTSFSVAQEAPASHPQLRPHRIAIGLYDESPDGLRRTGRVEVDIAGPVTPVPRLIGTARPDLLLVNDDDLTYAKVRLDEHSLRSAIRARGRFTDSLPAAICWTSSWDMVRDAELAARDFLTLALAGAGAITDINVLQSVLRASATAVRRFSDPAARPAAAARLASGMRELMFAAVPGSDQQLSFANSFIGIAASPDDLDLLAGLLDGSATIDGLPVDTELRWRLLHRLAGRGVAGEAEIEAELARDDTDAGQRSAASARAAIPTARAKEEAWTSVVDGSLPSATAREVLMGFQDFDQPALLAPYRQRFFDVIGDRWHRWGDFARFFAQVGYPVTDITQEAIDAAGAYLSRPDIPAALHRLLTEGRDDTIRALRCRSRDAQAATEPH